MITVPLVIGVIVAFVVALNLSVNYIPSVTSTILKLRSGLIPLVGNPLLRQYRSAPETVALLTGSLFWGALVASLVTGGVFGLVIFFFLWQGSVYFAQRFVAIFIGVLIITLLRLVIITCCRIRYFQGLYRKRPGAANLGILALEWASFALSSGFIFVRMVKLLLAAGFSIGRIDRPFLAPGVGQIGPIELDNFPTIFLRDILAHEAHRHPYLELLGTMYLTKLRYGKHFGKAAGSCWRLLFVYALMPWLHRYRMSTRTAIASQEMSQDFDPEQTLSSPTSAVNLVRLSSVKSYYAGTSQANLSRRSFMETAEILYGEDEMLEDGSTPHRNPILPDSTPHRRSSLMDEASIVEAIFHEEEGLNNDGNLASPRPSTMTGDQETIEKLKEENARLRAQLADVGPSQRVTI